MPKLETYDSACSTISSHKTLLLILLKHLAPWAMNQSNIAEDSSKFNDSSNNDNDSEDETIIIDLSNAELTPNNSLHALISKSKLRKIEKKCNIIDKISTMVKNNKLISFKSKEACSFIALGLSSAPALSYAAATTLFCCNV